MTTTETLWTVVTRDKGARFYRPVAGAVPGTWHEAAAQAQAVGRPLTTSAAWVPTQDSPQIEEDRDNVLESGRRSRRFPIRWDAEPRHAITLESAQAALKTAEWRIGHASQVKDWMTEERDILQALVARLTPTPPVETTPTPTPEESTVTTATPTPTPAFLPEVGAELRNGATIVAFLPAGAAGYVVLAAIHGHVVQPYATWAYDPISGETFSGCYRTHLGQALQDLHDRAGTTGLNRHHATYDYATR